jgi:hypothetical protein
VAVAVAGEVAVGAVDVDQAGAHVARELVAAESGAQRDGGERVAQIVKALGRGDGGGALRGGPVALSPVVQVEGAAFDAGKRSDVALAGDGIRSSASSAARWSGTARSVLVLVGLRRSTRKARSTWRRRLSRSTSRCSSEIHSPGAGRWRRQIPRWEIPVIWCGEDRDRAHQEAV